MSVSDLLETLHRNVFLVVCLFCTGHKGFFNQMRSRKADAAKGQKWSGCTLQVQEGSQNVKPYLKPRQSLQGFSEEEVRPSCYWDHPS